MSDNGMLAFQLDDLRAKFAEGLATDCLQAVIGSALCFPYEGRQNLLINKNNAIVFTLITFYKVNKTLLRQMLL